MADQQPDQAEAPAPATSTFSRKSKFQKNQARYGSKIAEFNLQDSSAIVDGIVTDERQVTDKFFGVCYVLFVIIWMVCVIFSYTQGGISTITRVNDWDGVLCGGPQALEYPLMYFTNPDGNAVRDPQGKIDQNKVFRYGTCVKACPAKNELTQCKVNSQVNSCKTSPTEQLQFLNLCIPKMDGVMRTLELQIQRVLSSLGAGAGILVASLAICVLLNIGFVKLISAHPETVCKAVIGIVELFLVLIMVVIALIAVNQENSAIYGAIVPFAAIFLGFNCMLWCFKDDLGIAIGVIDTSADFYNDTKRLMFISMTYGFVLLIVTLAGTWSIICIYGMNEYVWVGATRRDDLEMPLPFNGQMFAPVQWQTVPKVVLGLVLFSTTWIEIFVQSMLAFVAMYASATYYWSSGESGSGKVMDGLSVGHKNHFGSIALGSLIHTIIKIMEAALDSKEDDGNAVSNAIQGCCLACLDGVLEALNVLAFANMAISGDTYCKSAMNGFMLNLKHLGKFFLAESIGGFLISIAKFLILVICMAFTLCILILPNSDTLDYYDWIAIVIIGLVNFILVAVFNTLFLGLFDEVIVCTLQCVCIDIDLNKKPTKGSESFRACFAKYDGERDSELQDMKQDGLGGMI